MLRSATRQAARGAARPPLARALSFESERTRFLSAIDHEYRVPEGVATDALFAAACANGDQALFRDLTLFYRDFGLRLPLELQDAVVRFAAERPSLFCMSTLLRLIRATGQLTSDSLYHELFYNHYNGRSVQALLSHHFVPQIAQMASPKLFTLFESILSPEQRLTYYERLRTQMDEEAFVPFFAGYLRLLFERKSEQGGALLWANVATPSLLLNRDFQENLLVFLAQAWNPAQLKQSLASIAPYLTQASWDCLMKSPVEDERKLSLFELFDFPHLRLQTLPQLMTLCAKSNRVSLLRAADKFSKRVDSAPLHILFARLYSQQKKVQSAFNHWRILIQSRAELAEEDVLLAMETFGELGNSEAFLACYNHYVKGRFISPTIVLKILVLQYSVFPAMSPIPLRNEVLGRTYPLLENARDKAWILRNMF